VKLLICILTLLCSTSGFCQTLPIPDYKRAYRISFGLVYPLKDHFRNPIENFHNNLKEPFSYVSLGYEHPRESGKKKNIYTEGGFNYFLNQIRLNPDSTKTNWCAMSLYMNKKYDLFPKNRYVDLLIGYGGLFGWQIMTVKKQQRETFRNFNASIYPHLELRIQPSMNISFGLSANFLYDGTQSKWKTFGKKEYSVDYTKFSGSLVNFSILWRY
jgi:hypothetical protein